MAAVCQIQKMHQYKGSDGSLSDRRHFFESGLIGFVDSLRRKNIYVITIVFTSGGVSIYIPNSRIIINNKQNIILAKCLDSQNNGQHRRSQL